MNYGSFRGQSETLASQTSAINSSTASGQREPTRSSVHLSYRGAPPGTFQVRGNYSQILTLFLAHVDNLFAARSVREDTAELASYALSDKASARSVSPPRQRPAQTSLESYFALGTEDDRSPMRNTEGLHHHIIQEVSEPVSPESSPSTSDRGPGTSALTNMLKHSPTESLHDTEEENRGGRHSVGGNWDEENSQQGRLIITTNGVEVESPHERTSLLGNKDTRFETHHPDWIRGEQDVERQEVNRRPAWPKLRNVILWPQEKGLDVARIIFNPKAWDGKAIWQHTVVEPVGYIPAVILGTLLNILDALSYGKFNNLLKYYLTGRSYSTGAVFAP